jgi:hypothetical protein
VKRRAGWKCAGLSPRPGGVREVTSVQGSQVPSEQGVSDQI